MVDQCMFAPSLEPPNCGWGVSGQSLRLTSACNPDSEQSKESRKKTILKASHGYNYLCFVLLWPVVNTAVELGVTK